jgi:hypothetical protein
MEVSGHLHALVALALRYPLDWRLGGAQSRSGRYREEKQIAPAENRTQILQPVARLRYLGSPHKRQHNTQFIRMLYWWKTIDVSPEVIKIRDQWDVMSSSLVGRYTFFGEHTTSIVRRDVTLSEKNSTLYILYITYRFPPSVHFSNSDDGNRMILRNVGHFLPHYSTLCPM